MQEREPAGVGYRWAGRLRVLVGTALPSFEPMRRLLEGPIVKRGARPAALALLDVGRGVLWFVGHASDG